MFRFLTRDELLTISMSKWSQVTDSPKGNTRTRGERGSRGGSWRRRGGRVVIHDGVVIGGSKRASFVVAAVGRCGVRLDTRNVKPFEKRSLLPPRLLRLRTAPSVSGPTEENPNRGFRHSNQKRPPLIGDWIKLRNGSKLLARARNSGLGPVLGWERREGREVTLNLETEQFGQITDTGISLMSQSEEREAVRFGTDRRPIEGRSERSVEREI